MNTIYKNDKSLTLYGLLALAGVVLIALAAADYFGLWVIFGGRAEAPVMLLFVGFLSALIGFRALLTTVREILVEPGKGLVVRKALGRAAIPAAGLENVSLLGAANKESLTVLLSTSQGSWSFPMAPFAAERFIETIKAINPATKVDRHA